MNANGIDQRTQIWQVLDGKRIVLAGLENDQRQIYAQNLVHISSQKSINLVVSENLDEITDTDLVLLFAQVNKMCGSKGSVDENKENNALKLLMEHLEILTGKHPSSAVLISDCHVYGKQFGLDRGWKEKELGYIAHTSRSEISLQYMRMAEHLACRLAKEEQLHIRVVRQNLREETENLEQMMEGLIRVLLYGVDGEIYNLPPSGTPLELGEEDERSPLSPVRMIPDTEKIESLIPG